MLRFLRSLLAGGVATLADLATLFVLVTMLHVPAHVANVPALVVGGAVQFFANRHFVFDAKNGALARQAFLFIVVEGIALLLNGLLFDRALHLVPESLYAIARLVTSNVVFLGFSYPLWRFVFRTNKTGAWTRSPSSPRTS